MKQFPENLRSALSKLIEKATARYLPTISLEKYPLSAPASELRDAAIVCQALKALGYTVNLQSAFAIWELYSTDMATQWMDGPNTLVEAVNAIESLCENIAAAQDYAGFTSS